IPCDTLIFDNGDIALMKVDKRTKNIEACSQPERINMQLKNSLLKSDNKNKIIIYFSPMNLNDDEFNDLCKGFETQNLNEGKENSMKIDEKVKLNETPQVMGEENVS
ncbi:10018_t:CDS:2, partial [Funneliformis geosporum]